MANKRLFSLFLVVSLSLLFSMTVSAQDCTTTTDGKLVVEIQKKLKEKYASQMNHINVRSKDRVVTIEGWATTKKIKGEIEKIVKKVKCVKSKEVKNALTVGVGGGCGPGTKPCGTICIPIEEKCNIGKSEEEIINP